MSDPIERLRSFDPDGPASPAAAAEIRRRGDRRRRRQAAGVAIGAALAVVAIAVPVSVLGSGGDAGPQPAPPASSQRVPSESPSEAATEPESTTGRGEIPEGFPLLAGYPSDDQAEPDPQLGRQGPSPDLDQPELDFVACGEPLPIPPITGRLRAGWVNVEDFRFRQLLTFADADQAVAFVGQAVDFYRACPEETGSRRTVVQTRVAGQSYAAGQTYGTPDAPATGLTVVHVVRLGRAVLLDYASGEGFTGGAPEAATREQAARMTDDAAEVVAAMCAFTRAGC